MNDFPPNMNRDDLDEQIRSALQVQTSSQQLVRLETIWLRRSRAQTRRRRIAVASALAAGLLVAITVSRSIVESHPDRAPIAIEAPPGLVSPTVSGTAQVSPPPTPEGIREKEHSRSMARVPTTYERFVFVARSHRAAKRPSTKLIVANLIEDLVHAPDTDVEQLVGGCELDPPAMERLLLRRLPRARQEQVQPILTLLGIYGTPRSAPHVLRLAQSTEFRDVALTTLEQMVGVAQMPAMAAQSPNPRVRAAIFRRLLTADGDDSLDVYLALIQSTALSDEALAVANQLPEPLLARLFHRLDDKDQNVRLAAALVLGHANAPGVTEELIQRATATDERKRSMEAWIALLACRNERATRFLAYAGRQPKLLGSLNRAYMWWQTRS